MISALNKMFATLPLPTANADPREALRVYCEACSNYSTDDVELAVRQFIEGTVKNVNAAFAPTAPQFVTQMRANLEYTGKIRAGKNALLEQFKEQERDEEWAAKRTPEVKAHIREMVDGFVNSVDEKKRPKTPEEHAKEMEKLRRHDALFADQFGEYNGLKISSTLAKQFGVVLSPADDADEGDMGGMK
jgi:hypothetical protein